LCSLRLTTDGPIGGCDGRHGTRRYARRPSARRLADLRASLAVAFAACDSPHRLGCLRQSAISRPKRRSAPFELGCFNPSFRIDRSNPKEFQWLKPRLRFRT
jgi:hypothetical protein